MKTFKRRYYSSLTAFLLDIVWPFQNRRQLRRAMQGGCVSFAFRERLMLTVTAVNDCRYCSYFHAKEALKANLSDTEIQALLAGAIADTPADEIPALLYAQHWAESDANPDPAARQSFRDHYDQEKAETIETILRMIRTGNLAGNTVDYLLYRLSWGRWGGEAQKTPSKPLSKSA